MKPVVVRLLARAFDVVIPGAGLVLAGPPDQLWTLRLSAAPPPERGPGSTD